MTYFQTKATNGSLVDVGSNSAIGAAIQQAHQNEEQMRGHFGCSQEQILSPIQIKRSLSEASEDLPAIREITINESEKGNYASRTASTAGMGGVVPYAEDLDPYFFNRFNGDDDSIVEDTYFNHCAMESDQPRDLKFNRNDNITEVRTLGLRGPMLMSGWGYDIGGKPVPAKSTEGDESFEFADEMANDLTKWKSGPVDLMWDEERQVWAGGLPMLMGVATTDIEAPEDPTTPTQFTIEVLRKGDDGAEPPFITLPGGDPETVELHNFDPSLSQKMITKNREGDHDWEENPSLVWVLAIKMNYKWIPFYVGCPDECKAPEDCVALYQDDPAYAGQGADDVSNWECEDGDCVFNPSTPDPDPDPDPTATGPSF